MLIRNTCDRAAATLLRDKIEWSLRPCMRETIRSTAHGKQVLKNQIMFLGYNSNT